MTYKKIADKIFTGKEKYHKDQAKLPIEEKIRILVELQKIALTIRPVKNKDDNRKVWKLS